MRWLLFLLVLSGCSNNLPKYNELDKLRILALKADPPEVTPGATVVVTPLISDLDGSGRTLTYQALACSDPGVALGATPDCDSASDRVDVASGTITALTSPNYTGSVASFNVTVPSTLLDSSSTIDQFNGVAYIVTYELTASDGTTLKSFRRIIGSTKTTKNTNPSVSNILSGTATITAAPTSWVNLKPEISTASTESYDEMDITFATTTKTESLLTSWFISDGSTLYLRTTADDSNGYSPPTTTPTDHDLILIAVVRDERGGVDFTQLSLQ